MSKYCNPSTYSELVPSPPRFRRTEGDGSLDRADDRERPRSMAMAPPQDEAPGIQTPSLISSYQGDIKSLLLVFPTFGVEDPILSSAYRSVIAAMRPGTQFAVCCHEEVMGTVSEVPVTWVHRPRKLIVPGVRGIRQGGFGPPPWHRTS